MKIVLFACILAGLFPLAGRDCMAAENIARGKPYKFNFSPDYKLCTDEGDAVQLTDGEFADSRSKGWFWTRKGAVGWKVQGGGERTVTLDLGQDEPISGFAWNFGAGASGVSYPDLIFVYVSSDGKSWDFAGDLYAKSKAEIGAPGGNKYEVYFARSHDMPAYGRYVMFLAYSSSFLFVDEIEVYRAKQNAALKRGGKASILQPLEHYASYRGFKNYFSRARKIGEQALLLPEEARAGVMDALVALNAKVLQAKGYGKPFLWVADRWASADVLDCPAERTELEKPFVVEMMRGEVRSEAVNVTNPIDKEIVAKFAVEGLPPGANVSLGEIVPTLVKSGIYVGSFINESGASTLSLTLRPGETRQIWVSFIKPECKPGTYRAKFVSGFSQMDIVLRVSKIEFPSRPRLHVGGWDYTHNGGRYYGSTSNLHARLDRMREMYVDTPWATRSVLPQGARFDGEGKLLNADRLDFSVWNEWVRLWGDDARQYCVFLAAGKDFMGEKMGTERFARMLGDYMRAWYDGIRDRLKGRRVILLVYDEPWKSEHDEIFIAWAKVIRKAVPEFTVFVDSDRSPKNKRPENIYEVCDIVCPPLPEVTAIDAIDYYRNLSVKGGKEVWFYSCCGPSRSFDPIVYYRAQAWYAWKAGAKATMFWAFGCGGGIADSFRPFAQKGVEYSPFYVSPTNAYKSKQSEAIVESVQDYEYLAILSDLIEKKKAVNVDTDKYERILKESVDAALPKEEWLKSNKYSFGVSASRYDWFGNHAHDMMDRMRLELLGAIEELEERSR